MNCHGHSGLLIHTDVFCKGYSNSLLMSSSLWENSSMSSSLCSSKTFSWMSRASFLIVPSCYRQGKAEKNNNKSTPQKIPPWSMMSPHQQNVTLLQLNQRAWWRQSACSFISFRMLLVTDNKLVGVVPIWAIGFCTLLQRCCITGLVSDRKESRDLQAQRFFSSPTGSNNVPTARFRIDNHLLGHTHVIPEGWTNTSPTWDQFWVDVCMSAPACVCTCLPEGSLSSRSAWIRSGCAAVSPARRETLRERWWAAYTPPETRHGAEKVGGEWIKRRWGGGGEQWANQHTSWRQSALKMCFVLWNHRTITNACLFPPVAKRVAREWQF